MKKVGIFLCLLAIFLLLPLPVEAKKKITRNKKSQSASQSQLPNTPWTTLKLRIDRNALTLAIGNLETADQVDYTLTYTSDSVDQGISGTLSLEKTYQQKEFLFGTCSGTNCTYHQEITNMTLKIVVKLKSGQTLTRSYQINP